MDEPIEIPRRTLIPGLFSDALEQMGQGADWIQELVNYIDDGEIAEIDDRTMFLTDLAMTYQQRANASATLALVAEQRTANYLALINSGQFPPATKQLIAQRILARLDITPDAIIGQDTGESA